MKENRMQLCLKPRRERIDERGSVDYDKNKSKDGGIGEIHAKTATKDPSLF